MVELYSLMEVVHMCYVYLAFQTLIKPNVSH